MRGEEAMDRTASASARKSLAWLGGLVATTAALLVGAVLALFTAATVVLIALMTSATLAFVGLAMRARRTVRRPADPDILAARHVGGHSWVAYGWNERR
jgi:hypothetical protein